MKRRIDPLILFFLNIKNVTFPLYFGSATYDLEGERSGGTWNMTPRPYLVKYKCPYFGTLIVLHNLMLWHRDQNR